MSLADLTREAVLEAVGEFDRLGRQAFLERYGFGPARAYFLEHDGKLYDSKAIAGAAYGYARPDLEPLHPADFSGGEATVGRRLTALGFTVVKLAADWNIPVGNRVRRADIHQRYGGSAQSGIAPCASTPHVLLFTDPAVGPEHGYYDEWAEDGTFHYTGEGQHGDQRFDRGNKAVLEHVDRHRVLRLFEATGQAGFQSYVGEFELDPADPYHLDRAPETGGGPLRTVIIFHLVPVGQVIDRRSTALGLVENRRVEVTDLEARNTEQYLARPHQETLEKERREQELLLRYAEHLRHGGAVVTRRIYRVGAARPLACDAFDETNNVLIEARGTVDRNSVRLAVGQLLDYARFHEPRPALRILLARKPGPDLVAYLDSVGVQIAYPGDGGFDLHSL
jgi:hypothetical protein